MEISTLKIKQLNEAEELRLNTLLDLNKPKNFPCYFYTEGCQNDVEEEGEGCPECDAKYNKV